MIRLVLLSGVLLTPLPLQADDELPRCPVPQCVSSEYPAIAKLCFNSKCISSHLPPTPIHVDCTRNGSLHSCNVWPRGDDLTYDWLATGDGRVSTPMPTASPTAQIVCTDNQIGSGGSYSVTVTSPYGVSASQYGTFGCGAHTIEP